MTPKKRLGGRWKQNELLARHASLRIGGPAKIWAEVHTTQELDAVLRWAYDEGQDVHVVGLGSNVLFPDDGIDALILRFGGELGAWTIQSTTESTATCYVGAGAINAHLVRSLLREGWVGMEFLALIPGTFGGAVAMNAGTKEKELSEILISADIGSARPGTVVERSKSQLEMSYRHCELGPGGIVVGGTIAIVRGDVEAAANAVAEDKARRDQTQPYRLASVGSTFANPHGDYAGRMIEAVGLKGYTVGGAQVSERHANFFINQGGATADDFLRLMALARVRVRDQFGVELRPEVKFVGFDGWERLRALEGDISC